MRYSLLVNTYIATKIDRFVWTNLLFIFKTFFLHALDFYLKRGKVWESAVLCTRDINELVFTVVFFALDQLSDYFLGRDDNFYTILVRIYTFTKRGVYLNVKNIYLNCLQFHKISAFVYNTYNYSESTSHLIKTEFKVTIRTRREFPSMYMKSIFTLTILWLKYGLLNIGGLYWCGFFFVVS